MPAGVRITIEECLLSAVCAGDCRTRRRDACTCDRFGEREATDRGSSGIKINK